jgi:hypothetical protein
MTRGKKADSERPEARLDIGTVKEERLCTKKYSQDEHAGKVGSRNCDNINIPNSPGRFIG